MTCLAKTSRVPSGDHCGGSFVPSSAPVSQNAPSILVAVDPSSVTSPDPRSRIAMTDVAPNSGDRPALNASRVPSGENANPS